MAQFDYTRALQNIGTTTSRSLPTPTSQIWGGENVTGTDPSTAIGYEIQKQNKTVYAFPFDATNRFFVIAEGELSGAAATTGGLTGGFSNFTKVYRLPFPTVIQDTHEVQFDHNFNWMNALSKTIGSFASVVPRGSAIFNGAAAGAQAATSGLGYAVNNFKAVTLSAPNFRTFSLEFRMFPKTRAESDMIQKIVVSLKTGMHPEFEAMNLLFRFPHVFMMWFNTGNEYLYKFKPCVIHAMQVNYQGDQQVPAFFRNPADLAIPEGVVIRMSCIELEVWTQGNFRKSTDATTGLLNSDPLSAVGTGYYPTTGGSSAP